MSNDKQEILDRLIGNLAEVITEDELRKLIQETGEKRHYIGFEISGYVHLGTGILSSLVMKDLADLGVQCTVWLADWHTWINEKLDGTLGKAQEIGPRYFAEAIKASYGAVGGDPDNLKIKLASEEYKNNWERYWKTVISISQYKTVSRMLRSIDVMGREQGTDVELAKLLYPAMQAADIFYQEVDIAHAGMDQRKAHVIARDVALKIDPELVKGTEGKKSKPIALHHPLLQSLNGKNKEDKMSKSDPNSAIFVHDKPEEIEKKIKQAFAPEKEIEHNPILNWTRNLLFWNRGRKPFRIEREEKHGGAVEFNTFADLETAYAAGDIHPMDLKNTVAQELIELLAPVREHFGKPEVAAQKAELDQLLKSR